jgi:putative restriction endonuclease
MSPDLNIINIAFEHIVRLDLIYGSAIPNKALKEGFLFNGERVSLIGPQGIFKAKQMQDVALSILTPLSRDSRKPFYLDKESDDGFYHYAFEESKNDRNSYLYASHEKATPFIYFKAVMPAIYQSIWPCFVDSINEKERYFKIIVGNQPKLPLLSGVANYEKPKELEARYYVRESKVRGHQAAFRENILEAYKFKCAITGLSETKLLEAAHIIPDSNELSTQQITNGIALNRLHHRAYDAELLGIDTDYRIHIGTSLSDMKDELLLDKYFLSYNGTQLNLPKNRNEWPDVNYLNRRFEAFTIRNGIGQ